MVNWIVAAAVAAASPEALPAAPADASPAIFVVRDQDTTIYIFGTFHALDGKSAWFNDEVKSAFDRSGELVLETVIPEVPTQPVLGASRHQFGPVTTSASFLATTRMAIDAGRSQGMNVRNGADMVLRDAADLAGKRVDGLETLESQLAMFTRMPAAAPAQPPRPGDPVEDETAMEKLSRVMTELQGAWNRGDQAVFIRMLDQLRRNSPQTYQMMFTERNSRWADWIAARMQTSGTVFVAVGAGHLAGKDSLLVRLAELGIESSRLN